jgi:hypothetical protein
MIHEGAHCSIDDGMYNNAAWEPARDQDGLFISDYAREYDMREDVAETMVAWFATRYKPDIFTAEELARLEETFSGRFAVFDCQEWAVSPWEEITLSCVQPYPWDDHGDYEEEVVVVPDASTSLTFTLVASLAGIFTLIN